MREVLDYYRNKIESSSVLTELKLKPKEFFLVSIHREENVDNKEHLKKLLNALERLRAQYEFPVIISTHPRTCKRLEALEGYKVSTGLQFLKPFGFVDYNKLQTQAFCVVSDSGTISEEAAILGFPAITARNAMERPEALDTGSIVLSGLGPEGVIQAVEVVTDQFKRGLRAPIPNDYTITNVSQRVINLIISTAKLSNLWAGLVPHDYS